MDSPLLPTMRSRPASSGQEASLLADLSMDDYGGADDSFLPSSPIRPNQSSASTSGSASRSVLPPRQQPSASASASASVSRGYSHVAEDQGDDQSARKAGTSKPRFSLFAPPRPPSAELPETGDDGLEDGYGDAGANAEGDGEGIGEDDQEDQTIHAGTMPGGPSQAERDDKLRESLYELRRMNEVFDGFLGALEASRGHNERLAVRVKQTSALLDQYTELLGQAEHTQALLSNPNWTGAHDDAAAVESERRAKEQAEEARRQAAERAAEATRLAAEERERRVAQAEQAREPGRGGSAGRGARGGTRGLVRGARGTGSGIPVSTGTRPTGAKTLTTGLRKPSGTGTTGTTGGPGRGGYAHVQSSGYGPSGRK